MRLLTNKNGVTLIELLIVIVVLGIITAFAAISAGSIITNTKQNGDIAVVSNLNAASRLMRASTNTVNGDIFEGYDTDLERLTYLFEQEFISKFPEPRIETNSFVYDESLQLWTLSGSGGSIIYTETEEEYFNTSGSKITSYDTNGGLSVVIPTEIDGTTITELGQDSFKGLGINSVIIQEGITRISGNSFHTNNLTSVSIPNSVTRIWHNAFYKNQITTVTFGSGLERIEAGAFADNYITSLSLPSSVNYVGAAAFGYGGNHITSITIGSDVQIGNNSSFGSYGGAFRTLYNVNKESGTYTYSGGTWTKQ